MPSGGHLEQEQLDRLTQELTAADPGKPVIVALHHPPYSIDAHHGGSVELATGVTFEFGDASRYGFLKLAVSGHTISSEYVGVKPGTMPDGSDAQITAQVDTF